MLQGEGPGYYYTQIDIPNLSQLANKIAALEGLDLIREKKEEDVSKIIGGYMFGSGMAAVTSAILARINQGNTIIAQHAVYGATLHIPPVLLIQMFPEKKDWLWVSAMAW